MYSRYIKSREIPACPINPFLYYFAIVVSGILGIHSGGARQCSAIPERMAGRNFDVAPLCGGRRGGIEKGIDRRRRHLVGKDSAGRAY